MKIAEFAVVRSDDALLVRRTRVWKALGLVTAAFPLTILAWIGQVTFNARPRDWVSLFMILFLCAFMAVICHRILIRASCLIFDRRSDQFRMDGRRVCALSDLTWVRLEVTYRSPVAFPRGTFVTLHVRTAQGQNIVLKSVPERSREHDDLRHLGATIADFVGARSSIL